MKFVMILAACAAFAVVTIGMVGGQSMVGTQSQATSPLDIMKDARGLTVETIDNPV